MQVSIIQGGEDARLATMYNRPSDNALQYMQMNYQSIPQMLGQAGQAIFQTIQEKIKPLDYELLGRIAHSFQRQVSTMWLTDMIQPLTTIGMFQNPPTVMRRWLMAEPTVRQWYHEDRLEGYGENYIDVQPGKVGEAHSDYRIVMDGIVTSDENGYDTHTNYHYGDVEEDEIETMTIFDRASIISSWGHLKDLLIIGSDDPTSKWNAGL